MCRSLSESNEAVNEASLPPGSLTVGQVREWMQQLAADAPSAHQALLDVVGEALQGNHTCTASNSQGVRRKAGPVASVAVYGPACSCS